MLAPHPAQTAPDDGRVIHGWLRSEHGAEFIAVGWAAGRWVDLQGDPVPPGLKLMAWGEH